MVSAEADQHSKASQAGKTPEFSWVGYAEVQAATILSGFRWALTQVLLKSQDIGMDNPLATNMFLSPIVASTLFFGFLAEEGLSPLLSSVYFQTFGSSIGLCASIFAAGCLAFLMVNIEFGVISATNVITFSIAGIVKEILTIWTSQIVFGDKLEGNAGIGLAVSIFGIIGKSFSFFYMFKSTINNLLICPLFPRQDTIIPGSYKLRKQRLRCMMSSIFQTLNWTI